MGSKMNQKAVIEDNEVEVEEEEIEVSESLTRKNQKIPKK
jgi:hypothetical protein